MTFETGYRFGKHAAEINDAYRQMYESRFNKQKTQSQLSRRLNESFVNEQETQSQFSKSFTDDFMSNQRRRRDTYEDDLIEMTDGIERFDADFNKKLEKLKRAISPQLLKMAKERGHRFNYDDIVSDDVQQPAVQQYQTQQQPQTSDMRPDEDDVQFDDEPTEQGNNAENLFNNVVVENPDDFGNEYDIDEMRKHVQQIYDLAIPQIEKAVDPVVAVKNACKQIPGCVNMMPDSVGNIDADHDDADAVDADDEKYEKRTPQQEYPHRYFILLKEYYANGNDKYLNLYDNEEFWFDDVEEAKNTARNYLNLINRNSDGSINIESAKSRVVVAKIIDHWDEENPSFCVYRISNNSFDITYDRLRKSLKKNIYARDFLSSSEMEKKLKTGLNREKCDEYLINRGGGRNRDTRIDNSSTIDVDMMLDNLEDELNSVVGDDEESIRKRQEILARKSQLRDLFRSERTLQRRKKKRDNTVVDMPSEY